MSFKPTLLPGRYLVQDLSATRSFITTDETFNTDKSKRYEPVVVLPPGVLASIWEIEINNYPDNVKKGAYLIKVHGMPVIKSEGGKVVAYGGGRLDSQWNIDAHRIGTGEFCWSISRPQGPGHDEALYWSVSFSPLDHDEHGHKRVRRSSKTELLVPEPNVRSLPSRSL
ncbi:hypothetical protein BDY19DRAFT_142086 [Irpex rosettiformis]|uniref:Uncharacterized protein n=1 Tax=Irpex rosettiformis TaxID=378272 RepID=A0ACB8U2Z4_9APHY|nr:hypothetical protein BDY19DRAFT_142086 [Irpex rosettiformis]